MIGFKIFLFAIISIASGDPISDSFQREITKREAQRKSFAPAPGAPAPGPPDGRWIPGVNCRARRKREAQRLVGAPAPGAPAPGPPDDLPTCPGGGGSRCYTEQGRQCQFPFRYNGKTYNQCTTDSSNNGKAWCAYGYKYQNGIEADTYKLEDCQQSCGWSGSSSQACQCTQKTNYHGGGRCQKRYKGRYYCYVNRVQCRETTFGYSEIENLQDAGYYVNYSLCN